VPDAIWPGRRGRKAR